LSCFPIALLIHLFSDTVNRFCSFVSAFALLISQVFAKSVPMSKGLKFAYKFFSGEPIFAAFAKIGGTENPCSWVTRSDIENV
jgi:hypothetical protein